MQKKKKIKQLKKYFKQVYNLLLQQIFREIHKLIEKKFKNYSLKKIWLGFTTL